jgi:hypothetical protein
MPCPTGSEALRATRRRKPETGAEIRYLSFTWVLACSSIVTVKGALSALAISTATGSGRKP